MKLSRRVFIPIVLISLLAVSLCGIVYYQTMYQRVEDLQRKEVRAALSRLEDEMGMTSGLAEVVTDRVNGKNIALARSVAHYLQLDADTYMEMEALQDLAEELEIDVICIVAADGLNVAGTHEGYIGRNMIEKEEYRFLFDHMGDMDLAVSMDPVVNSSGDWIQYYIVPRLDDIGLVMVGVEYSIASILQQTFTDGINAEVTRVGETGLVALLHGSVYAAHPNAEMVGVDVGNEAWYHVVSTPGEGIDELEIDGTVYLAGHNTYEDGSTLLALLPVEEYRGTLANMRLFTFLLVGFTALVIVAAAYLSLRRNIMLPLAAVANSMKRIGRGEYESADIEDKFHGEMERLRQDINSTIVQLRGRQESVLQSYPGVIWSCDADYICTLSSGRTMEAMEYNPKHYLGRNLLEAVRETGDEESAQMIERTFTEGPQRIHKEISGRYLSMTTSQIQDKNGKVVGMVGVAADVTDMRQLQQQLIEATDAAERASEEARRASEAKSEFLSRMSHEIRTPMNAIIGMNTIARKSEDPEKILYCLEKIQIASDQLLRLINDVLDMSKIEANKFELSESEFDFEDMLQNVCNVVEVNTAEKQQDFVIDFSDVFRRNIVADELRLSQVLINLLNNAVKFTPEQGQITLKIRYEDVDKDFGRFHFDVMDNGIGISAEQQKRLFTSFEQADGSITRRYGGTGLGLAICKNIISLMGGEIKLESEPGKGSRFSFTIDAKWGNEKGNKDLVHRLPLGDNRILVIDDSEDVCLYFENILENYQLDCDTARSGPEGIKKVTAANEEDKPYTLIFIDWMMPGMDGTETARHIKTLVPPETIVIMISVADWSEIEQEARAVGVDKFLSKPVLPTMLFQSIVGWLNSSAAEKAGGEREEIKALFGGKCMLLAEDIEINREIIIGMLEGTGMEVVGAENGQKALDIYGESPESFDLILMDIQMPGIDGYEATRRLRASGIKGSDTIPIVAMTANAFVSDVEKCLEAGMDDHVAKPVNMEDLFQKIKAALQGPHRRHAKGGGDGKAEI